ncbi:hypothetical protein F0562_001144 [Nyssa sinensis]|uniref:Uncharacterized protein n=1 Tax=Nyssa sinensis TaxID=561372 RepID=A0A5J5C673_9ASTE|nr:hypothetical protein F0562_001144 [Nyssa sinensis]
MTERVAQQISLFRSQIENRRFDDGTLRILESVLVCKNFKSLLEVQSGLREFMRDECLCVIHGIADKSVEHKLYILDFFVRAFALVGDVESCLALRYEALILRELKSMSNQWLKVSYREWLTFAEHSLENGFYSIARKACENALSCFQMNGVHHGTYDFSDVQIINKIKRFKDFTTASGASQSVQAQAVEYLEKKTAEKSTKHSLHAADYLMHQMPQNIEERSFNAKCCGCWNGGSCFDVVRVSYRLA